MAKTLIDPMACLEILPSAGLNKYALRSTSRRSQVYAITRHLIGIDGLSNVTIRSIAHGSKASVQTLYNVIGDRTTIISNSINEYLAYQANLAVSETQYHNNVVAIAEIHSRTSIDHSAFTLNCLSGAGPMRLFDRQVEEFISNVQLRFLASLRKSCTLKDRVDLESTARSIILFSTSLISDWNGNRTLNEDFRRQLVTGVVGLLLPSLKAQAQADLGAWLDVFLASVDAPAH